jgi:PAS domain S-box/diguanylate cyclase (GGDEF) domain
MPEIPIEAIALPTFVVERGVVVACNEAARNLGAGENANDVVGSDWTDVFDATDDGFARLKRDGATAWYRLDATGSDDKQVILAAEVTDELHARAILEGLFADCFVLDDQARLAWKLTPRRRKPSSWSVDSHVIEQLHPDDLTDALQRFADALEQPGLRQSYTTRIKHPARAGHWELVGLDTFSGVADPWVDGVVICSRVNEAIDTQVDLVDSPFYSLAEAAPTGILVIDGRRHPVYLNELARGLLGIDSDAGTETWINQFGATDAEAVRAVVDAAFAGDRRQHHIAQVVQGDTTVWVRVAAVAQQSREQTVGVIVTLVDVTDVVEARADIDRLVDALQAGSDLVVVVTPDLHVTHWKGSGHEHFARLETAGLTELTEILGGDRADDDSDFETALEQILAGQSWRGELTIRIDATLVPVSVLCVPRQDADGRVESFAFVARDISELKQTQRRLSHLAMHDPLTGLTNRLGLRDELERELARWRRGELHGLALAFVDLDDFKEINDEFGHETGDHVLREVASRMQHALRPDDVLARIGGDEFVAVLGLQATGHRALEQLAERFTHAFAEPMLLGGRAVRLRASVGIVTVAAADEDTAALLARADAAMYEAKRGGKNQIRVA